MRGIGSPLAIANHFSFSTSREKSDSEQLLKLPPQSESSFSSHPWWDKGNGWNNILNNLRLILQPFVLFNLIKPWLQVFTIPKLSEGFFKLQMLVNNLTRPIFQNFNIPDFYFSSA